MNVLSLHGHAHNLVLYHQFARLGSVISLAFYYPKDEPVPSRSQCPSRRSLCGRWRPNGLRRKRLQAAGITNGYLLNE